jgi:hypothetical protein
MTDYWMYSSDEEEKAPGRAHGPMKFNICAETDSFMEENRFRWDLHLKKLEEEEKLAKESVEKLDKNRVEKERLRHKEFSKKFRKVQDRVNPRFMLPPFDRPMSECFEKYVKKEKKEKKGKGKKKKNVTLNLSPELNHTPALEYTLNSNADSMANRSAQIPTESQGDSGFALSNYTENSGSEQSASTSNNSNAVPQDSDIRNDNNSNAAENQTANDEQPEIELPNEQIPEAQSDSFAQNDSSSIENRPATPSASEKPKFDNNFNELHKVKKQYRKTPKKGLSNNVIDSPDSAEKEVLNVSKANAVKFPKTPHATKSSNESPGNAKGATSGGKRSAKKAPVKKSIVKTEPKVRGKAKKNLMDQIEDEKEKEVPKAEVSMRASRRSKEKAKEALRTALHSNDESDDSFYDAEDVTVNTKIETKSNEANDKTCYMTASDFPDNDEVLPSSSELSPNKSASKKRKLENESVELEISKRAKTDNEKPNDKQEGFIEYLSSTALSKACLDSYEGFLLGVPSPIPKEEPRKILKMFSNKRKSGDTEPVNSSPPKRAKNNSMENDEEPLNLVTHQKTPVASTSKSKKERDVGTNNEGNVATIDITVKGVKVIFFKFYIRVYFDY